MKKQAIVNERANCEEYAVTTEERLEQLEREMADIRDNGGKPAPKVIRAGKFVLENTEGKPRAILSVDDNGPGWLALYAADGKPGIILRMDVAGPTLAFYDENGNKRVSLSVTAAGPRLRLLDEGGKGCAALDVTEWGPVLALFDAEGKIPNATLSVTTEGPVLSLRDGKGISIARLPPTQETPKPRA